MSTITFDTLKFANTLKEAGVPDRQAEAQARAQRESFAEAFDAGVAMRADIARLDANIKADMLSVKSELKADIARIENRIEAMELRLIVKLGTFVAVAVASTAALVKLLP